MTEVEVEVEVVRNRHTGRWSWWCREHGASLDDWPRKDMAERLANIHRIRDERGL